MFLSLGVPANFAESVVSKAFSEIKSFFRGYTLDDRHLRIVLHILQWIHQAGKENMEVLLPTENRRLLPPKDCTYNDRYWSGEQMKKKNYTFVHPEIPLERAKFFKVVPLGQRLAPSRKLGLKYIQKGPHQSVTSRLNEAIEDYGSDVDVFKELIQNADDARATEVKFLIDWRQHPYKSLLEPEMKPWQGPALLAYNNAVFTSSDLENICELAGGSKKSDPTKIGRFGIGFCSIYHLTDVPSFITRNYFTVFDPHTSYLGGRVSSGEPGMQIDLKENFGDLDEFRDQFMPYIGMFDFDLTKVNKGYNGTLFRFPFRNYNTAAKSKISPMVYDKLRVERLCNTLKESAPELLLFLQHVKEVSLYELDANSSVENMKCVLSVTKTLDPNSAVTVGPTLIEQFRLGLVSSSQSHQKKVFKVEGVASQGKYEHHWMVTSCLGTDKSKRLAQSGDGKSNGLCPLAEIGVKLNKSSSFIHPQTSDGKLFCFLPLPIQCNLKFYCSGYFDISKDRRWLKKDSSGRLTEWNSAVISDALYNCFVNTIVALTELCSLSAVSEPDKKKFLAAYYSLWSTSESSHNEISKTLFREIKKNIHLTDKLILWSDVNGGKWLSPKNAYLYSHVFNHNSQPEIRNEIVSLLLKHKYPIVDIPYNIKSILEESVPKITYEDFCVKVLIPNITILPAETRDRQIITLLLYLDSSFHAHWAKKLLMQIPSIPTKPFGSLKRPVGLINPRSHLVPLYCDSDECFPMDTYMIDDRIVSVLKRLGMSDYELTMDKLKDRALSVKKISDEEAAIQRSKQVLMYISHVYGYSSFRDRRNHELYSTLQSVPFVPVSKCPQGLSLPWYKPPSLFQCPKDVFGCAQTNLVFTQAAVVMSFDSVSNSTIANSLTTLRIDSKQPTIKFVVTHFVQLVEHVRKNLVNDIDTEMLNNCCPAVYKCLCEAGQHEFSPNVFESLKGLPFIWQNHEFLTISQVVLHSGIACGHPYLYELSDENKKYKELFIKLGLLKKLEKTKILILLGEVYQSYTPSKKLTEEHIRFVFNLAQNLTQSLNNPNECYSGLYLPNEDSFMRPASKLAYREAVDLPNLTKSEILSKHFEAGTSWLHPLFSGELAKSLGIPSALTSILNKISVNSFLDGTDYGQSEDLCDRLNSILRKYPHDESIFKEFIQNADDAGASEIVFILDHRIFNPQDDKLFSREPEWRSIHQCPSLLVYNNRKMSEEDIAGITKLGRGNKGFSPELIGRFGIGFNVAYHVTDCPAYVSYSSGGVPKNYCILDPSGMYVPGHKQRPMRGRRFIISQTELEQFSEEFKPFYSEVFTQMSGMCDKCFNDVRTNFLNGFVLFRLPFTRSNAYRSSQLDSGCKMNSRYMQLLFKNLALHAEDLILFLSNIKTISAFEIKEDGSCFHHFTTSASLSEEDTAVCRVHAEQLKSEVRTLEDKVNRTMLRSSPQSTLRRNQDELLNEVSWNYQLNIHTVKCVLEDIKPVICNIESSWLISQYFGSNQIPHRALIAALSSGLIPKGGVAVKISSSALRDVSYALFCSLPLPIVSHMPVHVNGNFWVDDSRKHLEVGASQSFLSNWNCHLTSTVISDAYVNALARCKEFVQDKGTVWYYCKFPTESKSQDSKLHSFELDKTVYRKVVKKNLSILQQDSTSLSNAVTWLPVVGQGCGHFFCSDSDETQLRQLLIEFGIKLTKAPSVIHKEIVDAAITCRIKCAPMIEPVFLIQLLKSLNLQQHADTITKNIVILLKYCLSTEDGCSAIEGAPLLLTSDGTLRNLVPTVYGSHYAPLLPHKPGSFIHSILEQTDFIHTLRRQGFYLSIPHVGYVSTNSQLKDCQAPIRVEECQEYHSQIIEHWKFLDKYIESIKPKQYVSCLDRFSSKPIIPASNKTLVPVSKAKMVLSNNSIMGPIKNVMKQFGYAVLDFSVLCDATFYNCTGALIKILAHCNNGDDILKCIELNDLSPVLPSDCDLVQFKDDLHHLLNFISTSKSLPSAKSHLCKLPIFETVTDELHTITSLQNTYLIPDRVPVVGLKKVMENSLVLFLKDLPIYKKIYEHLGIKSCSIVQFYTRAVIPYLQEMVTKDIIVHVKFLFNAVDSMFTQNVEDKVQMCIALKSAKFIYVPTRKKWCSVSEFYDPEVKLFNMFLNADVFPPQEWHCFELLIILRRLGLQRDLSWENLLSMVKNVEQEIKQIDCPDIYHKSNVILEFICKKLNALHNDDDDLNVVDLAGLQFCKDISEIVFVPTHKIDQIVLEIFTENKTVKCWTCFNDACFATFSDTTFLEKEFNVITATFDLYQNNCHVQKYVDALGIEHPPTCGTVTNNLFKLSKAAKSLIQSSTEQREAIRNFLKKLFGIHYTYLEKNATLDELQLLQGEECIFAESDLTFSVVSQDCVVKSQQLPHSMFPYLCLISKELTECQKIMEALGVSDSPNSIHYANVLRKIHLKFDTPENKLRDNSKYLGLASTVCDCLVKSLRSEESTQSVPDAFGSTALYLLDKQYELCLTKDLAYDDVPWYSRRLQNIQAYRYMKEPPRDEHGCVTLPQSLGVKPLSSLVVEELDVSVLAVDNHCREECIAHERGQTHGCPFVLCLENLMQSPEFKLGVSRIIHHQKNTELSEAEISLVEKLSGLKLTCYYEIKTILKYLNGGSIIQGSSDTVFCVLINGTNSLCIAPHSDDKDDVVKEIAQNLNRYLGGIIQNMSHLEAMIKCPSHLDIESALDKCQVKAYAVATRAAVKLTSVGEEIMPTICDLLIAVNYNIGESVKYWSDDGKMLLAKVIAVKSKTVTNIAAKSITISTSDNNDGGKIKTSPILISKFLQPSFFTNWISHDNKMTDCTGLLLYHLEHDPVVDLVVLLRQIVSSLKTVSNHQVSIIFKRLFFQAHFYFVKCNKAPDLFNKISLQYFWAQEKFITSTAGEEECNELAELMGDMCIYIDDDTDLGNNPDTINDDNDGIIARIGNPFANRDFSEIELNLDNDDDDLSLLYVQRQQTHYFRKPHRGLAATVSSAQGQWHSTQSNIPPRSTQSHVAQPSLSSTPNITNVFSQPVVLSTPTHSGLYRTSTGGYRSRACPRRPANVSVWNQRTPAATNAAPPRPQTNFRNAFMWLKQAIADYNAAKCYIDCSSTAEQQVNSSGSNSCQFPALVCFLSHEVVEKCLKATYLAACGSTLTDQRDLSLVELYDYLSTSTSWPLTDIRDFVHQVSDHNKRCRYPSFHVPPEAPCVVYNELDARHALAAAQEVFAKVCSIQCFKDKLPSQPALLPLLPSTTYLDPDGKYIGISSRRSM